MYMYMYIVAIICGACCMHFFLQTVSVPWVERAENNEKKIEYLEDNIQDPILKAALRMSYSMFKVLTYTQASRHRVQNGAVATP